MCHWAHELDAAASVPIGRVLGGLECEAPPDSRAFESSLTVTGGHSRSFLAAADWVVSGVSAAQLTNSR